MNLLIVPLPLSSLAPLHPSPLAPLLTMMAPTHIAFGVLSASLLGLLAGTPLTPEAFALAILGALLPDVDTTGSAIGRLLYPLAAVLERRLGHRTLTHSLAGLLLAAALPLPFVPFRALSPLSWSPVSWLSWSAFITGYASHLLADSMTKSGIPLFWPNTTFQAVLPGNEAYRFRVGSSAEYVLLAILLPITTATLPLSQMSLTQALHYLIRDVNSAAGDYRTWAGQYVVWVELEGRHNLSQKPVQGIFEAIDTAGQNAIIIRDSQGDIYAAGTSRDDEIYVHRIRAVRGRPVRTEIQEVRLANQLLGDLRFEIADFRFQSQIPNLKSQIWIQGWFVTPQRPLLIDDVGEYNRSKRAQSVAGQSLFEIRYFTPADLAPFQAIYVTRAHFIIRTIHPRDPEEPK